MVLFRDTRTGETFEADPTLVTNPRFVPVSTTTPTQELATGGQSRPGTPANAAFNANIAEQDAVIRRFGARTREEVKRAFDSIAANASDAVINAAVSRTGGATRQDSIELGATSSQQTPSTLAPQQRTGGGEIDINSGFHRIGRRPELENAEFIGVRHG